MPGAPQLTASQGLLQHVTTPLLQKVTMATDPCACCCTFRLEELIRTLLVEMVGEAVGAAAGGAVGEAAGLLVQVAGLGLGLFTAVRTGLGKMVEVGVVAGVTVTVVLELVGVVVLVTCTTAAAARDSRLVRALRSPIVSKSG